MKPPEPQLKSQIIEFCHIMGNSKLSMCYTFQKKNIYRYKLSKVLIQKV